MSHPEEHPLTPLAEAIEGGAARAAAYFLVWLLGIHLPGLGERLVFQGIAGRSAVYARNSEAGVIAASHIAHPVGFLLMFSHIVLFAVFVRFGLRHRWLLWPLATGCLWRLACERFW